MRIGELADASGVSTRSLRYYEDIGLIRSARTPGGWRNFDESMIERVVLIQHLFAAGLRSATINELLPCLEASPEERTGLLDQLLAQEAERLEAKRRDIDRELETLQALRNDTSLRLSPSPEPRRSERRERSSLQSRWGSPPTIGTLAE